MGTCALEPPGLFQRGRAPRRQEAIKAEARGPQGVRDRCQTCQLWAESERGAGVSSSMQWGWDSRVPAHTPRPCPSHWAQTARPQPPAPPTDTKPRAPLDGSGVPAGTDLLQAAAPPLRPGPEPLRSPPPLTAPRRNTRARAAWSSPRPTPPRPAGCSQWLQARTLGTR